jgi:hypothetical protein
MIFFNFKKVRLYFFTLICLLISFSHVYGDYLSGNNAFTDKLNEIRKSVTSSELILTVHYYKKKSWGRKGNIKNAKVRFMGYLRSNKEFKTVNNGAAFDFTEGNGKVKFCIPVSCLNYHNYRIYVEEVAKKDSKLKRNGKPAWYKGEYIPTGVEYIKPDKLFKKASLKKDGNFYLKIGVHKGEGI